MSIKYNDKNGTETVISGLTPGGDLTYGVSTTRSGIKENIEAGIGSTVDVTVTFIEPMPDSDYIVEIFDLTYFCEYTYTDKSANSFQIHFKNTSGVAWTDQSFKYKAFKLYSVDHAASIEADLIDIEADIDIIESKIPSSASSSNKMVTASDFSSVTNRVTTIEGIIPATTSTSNKLINQTELTTALENVEIDVDSALSSTSTNPVQNKVVKAAIDNAKVTVDAAMSTSSTNPVQNKVINTALTAKVAKTELLDLVYPIGSIYLSINSTNPKTLFGGTWTLLSAGYVLKTISSGTGGTTAAAGKTGGTTLSASQVPLRSHTHTYSQSSTATQTTALTASQVPLRSHYHAISTAVWKSAAVSTGGHQHNLKICTTYDTGESSSKYGLAREDSGYTGFYDRGMVVTDSGHTGYVVTGGAHAHNISVPAHNTSAASVSTSAGHAHRITLGTATSGSAGVSTSATHNHDAGMPQSISVYAWKRTA